MGHKSKTPKGEISITNSRGRIRLRWRFEGQRYSLNLPYAYQGEYLHYAKVKVAEIKLDIMKECFDTTLQKYDQPVTSKKIKPEKDLSPTAPDISKIISIDQLAPAFDNWGKTIRNVDVDNAVDYLYVRKWLEKRIGIPVALIVERLNKEQWAVTTYNRRLFYLTIFLTWLQANGQIESNPLKDVVKKRDKNKKRCGRRVPLEEAEILQLLEAIRKDTYCSINSRFKHSFYYPFLFFIFHTGVRNAEAIGLKVKHVDVINMQVEISETFARTVKGTSHAARVSKGTKTENVRYLPLTKELLAVIQPLLSGRESSDFVFQSPNGLTIDDKMLNRRVLKPVLKRLGLGDRDLYVARHSFGTRAVQQGMVLTEVAYLMGHSTVETTMRNYVSVTKPATSLPTLK